MLVYGRCDDIIWCYINVICILIWEGMSVSELVAYSCATCTLWYIIVFDLILSYRILSCDVMWCDVMLCNWCSLLPCLLYFTLLLSPLHLCAEDFHLVWSPLPYAILYYAELCYAILCCAILCYTILCYAIPHYTVLRCAVLCYTMLCYTVSVQYRPVSTCLAYPCVLPLPLLYISLASLSHVKFLFILSYLISCCV